MGRRWQSRKACTQRLTSLVAGGDPVQWWIGHQALLSRSRKVRSHLATSLCGEPAEGLLRHG